MNCHVSAKRLCLGKNGFSMLLISNDKRSADDRQNFTVTMTLGMACETSSFYDILSSRKHRSTLFFVLSYMDITNLKSQKRPTVNVFVYKIQVNPIHTILKYGGYYDFMGR